jgi:hypothetical protein
VGTLHLIWPRNAENWKGLDVENDSKWSSTIGNTVLSDLHKRPREASEDFASFKSSLLDNAVDNEWTDKIERYADWTANEIQEMGEELADAAGKVWYGD